MRVLLGSGGVRTEARRAHLVQEMKTVYGAIETVAFVPYALGEDDAAWDAYVTSLTERGLDAGYRLEGVHRAADPAQALANAAGVFVGGGNSFRLLEVCQRLGLLDVLRERVAAGVPYVGVSAGANLACPTIRTTNDMPIATPPHGLDALGLVPFQVNAHFVSGPLFSRDGDDYHPHFGETRERRIEEYHERHTLEVLGLWEGATLRWDGARATLGGAPAVRFRRGEAPTRLEPGATLS